MYCSNSEAVRVKVKKCEGKLPPELRKFSVDPQITSLEVLQSILAKAFDLKRDFNIAYRAFDDLGQEVYLPVISDWDLDAAFLKAHNSSISQKCEPCIQLRIDMKPFAEASGDWESSVVATEQEFTKHTGPDTKPAPQGIQGLLMNQVEKTFNMVSRAFNLNEDSSYPPRKPLSDAEFRSFLDSVGRINNMAQLKEAIYNGGMDPCLRKVVWKHILNVYPEGMTGKSRIEYIKKKASEYYALRSTWKECLVKGKVNSDLAYVTSMVKKDVLRTDRHHPFYAGSDENQNIAALFNVLTTYALNHPTVSYCQGMSDLASPLLVTMGDEAHAYICLCALMTRLKPNFLLDGEAMTRKFAHLTECLQAYDPDFSTYLKCQQADDLLFCYRWLLLEMKREFAFDDALRMLEVLWASIPQNTLPTEDLSLKEKEYDPNAKSEECSLLPISPLVKTPRENAYTKVCAIRRQSSSFSLANVKARKLSGCKMNFSLDENVTRNKKSASSLMHTKEFQSLDDTALRSKTIQKLNQDLIGGQKDLLLSTNDYPKYFNGDQNKNVQNGHCVTFKDSKTQNDSMKCNFSKETITNTPLGSQIRLLRNRISERNSKFSTSLDKLETNNSTEAELPKVKMIKNLNEFLHLATGYKSTHMTKGILTRTQSEVVSSNEQNPKILMTSSSIEDNDLPKNSKVGVFSTKLNMLVDSEINDSSSPDDSQEYYPMTTSITRELRLELEHLDKQVFGTQYPNKGCENSESTSESTSTDDKAIATTCDYAKIHSIDAEKSDDNLDLYKEPDCRKATFDAPIRKVNDKFTENIYLWENPLHKNIPNAKPSTTAFPQTPDEQAELDFDCDSGEIIEDTSGFKSVTPLRLLRKHQSEDLKGEKLTVNVNKTKSEEETHLDDSKTQSQKFFASMSQELVNAKTLLNSKQPPNLQAVATTINNFQKKYELLKPAYQKNSGMTESGTSDVIMKSCIANLPPPYILGGGNPFLMFLCLTVLLQHRDYIMRNRMDYNELAMHFDKMVRKHNVNRVLNQARQMYAIYVKHQANNINVNI